MRRPFGGSTCGIGVIRKASNPAAHAMNAHERQAFWRADHLVEQRVHEVQRALELAIAEVAPPHFQGNALGGVPSVRAEAVGTSEALHPKACLRQGLNRTGSGDKGGVQGECHEVVFEVQRIS